MSHFLVSVILPDNELIEGAARNGQDEIIQDEVACLLAPYNENGEWFKDGSRWDWWMIGGRWDGEICGLAPLVVYEPGPCKYCNGTGDRPDLEPPEWKEECGGCNACHGEGRVRAWPTNGAFSTLERNMCRVFQVTDEGPGVAFVTPDGEWHENTRMGFWGMEIEDEEGKTKDEKIGQFDQEWAKAREQFKNHIVVAVDCHV